VIKLLWLSPENQGALCDFPGGHKPMPNDYRLNFRLYFCDFNGLVPGHRFNLCVLLSFVWLDHTAKLFRISGPGNLCAITLVGPSNPVAFRSNPLKPQQARNREPGSFIYLAGTAGSIWLLWSCF